jgi:hypothetical protein
MDDRVGRSGGALEALARFRRDGQRGAGIDALLRAADRPDAEGAARRREEVVSGAVRRMGLARVHAELIHDVAEEEGLEPIFAFELVRSGIAVCGAVPATPAPPDDTRVVEGTPEWVAPPDPAETRPTVELIRERRLRMSFRRLRGHLERVDSAEAAIAGFVAEPDVGDCGYLID